VFDDTDAATVSAATKAAPNSEIGLDPNHVTILGKPYEILEIRRLAPAATSLWIDRKQNFGIYIADDNAAHARLLFQAEPFRRKPAAKKIGADFRAIRIDDATNAVQCRHHVSGGLLISGTTGIRQHIEHPSQLRPGTFTPSPSPVRQLQLLRSTSKYHGDRYSGSGNGSLELRRLDDDLSSSTQRLAGRFRAAHRRPPTLAQLAAGQDGRCYPRT
jgi:hypothetical protein